MKQKSKDNLRKFHKSLRKPLKMKRPITTYHLLFFIIFIMIIIAIPMYWLGHNEGYTQKTREIQQQKTIQTQRDLMKLPLESVWHFFLKYLMVRTIFWLPWVMIVLGIGWILHGIF